MEGGRWLRRVLRVLVPLVVGYMTAAVAVFAVAWFAGSQLRLFLGSNLLLLSVPLLVTLAFSDVMFARVRPPMCRRQTPRSLMNRCDERLVGLLWGLDAGAIFSTYRASAASWGALVLALSGLVPPWAGLVYGAAFCIPLTVLLCVRPHHPSSRKHGVPATADVGLLISKLMGLAKSIRRLCAATSLAVAAVLIVSLINGGIG